MARGTRGAYDACVAVGKKSPGRKPAGERLRFPVVFRKDEDGWIVAECPVIPGCYTQGRTRAEAHANIREAILLALDCRGAEGWELPADVELLDVVAAS